MFSAAPLGRRPCWGCLPRVVNLHGEKVEVLTQMIEQLMDAYERNVNNYHLLMSRRVKDILLISNLYDACIINEDCRLSERIVREYK